MGRKMVVYYRERDLTVGCPKERVGCFGAQATLPLGFESPQSTAVAAVDGQEQETRTVAQRQSSEPQRDQSTQSPQYDCKGRSSTSAMADRAATPCRSKPWTGRPRCRA